MSRSAPSKDQLTVCTVDCQARCCRYITVGVDAPLSRADWDEMRWWLAHEGTFVSKDEDGWLLHLSTRCQNLRADNACGIYPHHMGTCKEYDAEECEFTGELDHEFELRSEMDLARYIERRKLKRAAEVAKDIRKAEKQRALNRDAGLTKLAGLS